jgi:porin
MSRACVLAGVLAGFLTFSGSAPALAQTASTPTTTARADPTDFFTDLWSRPTMLGDIGGLRTALGNYGISLGLYETSEVQGNTSGGLKQGAIYDGLTTLTLGIDTQKMFGWEGGIFNLSALQIHGRSLSQFYLANLQTASNIEATPTTRLWEIWYQQAFLGGKMDLKIGQQAVDQEFMLSVSSSQFVNTVMGWAALPSVDLYAGGPTYPLSTLGVRLRGRPTDNLTILGGVFQDNAPGGPFFNDSQLRGTSRYGINFNLRTGALILMEVQYAINQSPAGDTNQASAPTGLPGTYKLGVWYDTAPFPDLRAAVNSTSGAMPMAQGNYSLYALMDQAVWRQASTSRVVGVFARAMGAPGDRNLVDFSADAGITLNAPLPGRDYDVVGIGYGVAKISRAAQEVGREVGTFGGVQYPTGSSESFIEVTYIAQITPWQQLQPDFQYVFMPGGGLPNPYDPGKRIGNEAVFSVRTTITF